MFSIYKYALSFGCYIIISKDLTENGVLNNVMKNNNPSLVCSLHFDITFGWHIAVIKLKYRSICFEKRKLFDKIKCQSIKLTKQHNTISSIEKI